MVTCSHIKQIDHRKLIYDYVEDINEVFSGTSIKLYWNHAELDRLIEECELEELRDDIRDRFKYMAMPHVGYKPVTWLAV